MVDDGMTPYQRTPVCPACGYYVTMDDQHRDDRLTMIWTFHNEFSGCNSKVPHLHLKCGRCRYDWLMNPKDNLNASI